MSLTSRAESSRDVVSSSGARLIGVRIPREADSVVVVLHGGASRGAGVMVSPTQLSVLRMIPLAKHLARRGPRGAAVFRLLNSRRGWDSDYTPVADAHWALQECRRLVGEVPAVLVGHSLGGRAALMAGGHPSVRGVAALNAWVYPHDTPPLHGRRVLMVHGDEDRIAGLQRAATVATRLMRLTDAEFVTVPGGRHAMLRHGSTYHRLTSRFVSEVLT